MKRLTLPFIAVFLVSMAATSQEAVAQLGVDFGPEISYNMETENLGIGARLQVSPLALPIGFIANGQYVLCDEPSVDVSCSAFEFGVSGRYMIGLPASPIGPYVGAGLTHQRASIDLPGSTTLTETGAHVLGGIGLGGLFPIGAFLEGRYAFMEQNQFTIGAGILF